jgi:F-type H+-transporting ATPase subunit gamma
MRRSLPTEYSGTKQWHNFNRFYIPIVIHVPGQSTMSETLESLRHKIEGAAKLGSVVRTMKTLAASSLTQYVRAVGSLVDYYRTVELGLVACLQFDGQILNGEFNHQADAIGAVVFGSDQGLIGDFNEVLAAFAVKTLAALPGEKTIWAVGERIQPHLVDAGLNPVKFFNVPNSVGAIAPLVGQILLEIEAGRVKGKVAQLYVFHNQPGAGSTFEPSHVRVLPLDQQWLGKLTELRWPTRQIPEILNGHESTLHALIREYLFVSLFKACAESLASENTSRLSAMQRAEKNIDEILENLNQTFHQLRQSSIDEELFDIVAGFDALIS